MLQRITDLWPTLLRRAREGNDDLIEPLLGEDEHHHEGDLFNDEARQQVHE